MSWRFVGEIPWVSMYIRALWLLLMGSGCGDFLYEPLSGLLDFSLGLPAFDAQRFVTVDLPHS